MMITEKEAYIYRTLRDLKKGVIEKKPEYEYEKVSAPWFYKAEYIKKCLKDPKLMEEKGITIEKVIIKQQELDSANYEELEERVNILKEEIEELEKKYGKDIKFCSVNIQPKKEMEQL